jgi:hypothetical protein
MMDENSPPVKCSKPGCKRFVTNSQFKRCDPCRNRQAGIVKQGRQRRKAAEKESTLHGSKGRKCVQEDTNSSEERPTQRARPDNSGLAAENPHTIADDEGIYVVRHTPQKEKNDTRVDGRHLHTQ